MYKKRVYVAGHKGMVGSALVRVLKKKNYEIITKEKTQLDLLDQSLVKNFFEKEKIDEIYIAAAKVGGIYANNTFPAEFIYQNIVIQSNIIHYAFLAGVKKLLFLGSSCIYPQNAKQPMKEEELLSGYLEPTNEAYAIAKIAGIKTVSSYNTQYGNSHNLDYRSVMPTNLYGPGDNYHPLNSHVIPGLIRRFHEAKISNSLNVEVWGSGKPKREFMHVDDMADACVYLNSIDRTIYNKSVYPCSHINIGSSKEISIRDLAEIIKQTVGYEGKIIFNETKPDGNPTKLMDSQRLKDLNWQPSISLKNGLKNVYKDFLKNK